MENNKPSKHAKRRAAKKAQQAPVAGAEKTREEQIKETQFTESETKETKSNEEMKDEADQIVSNSSKSNQNNNKKGGKKGGEKQKLVAPVFADKEMVVKSKENGYTGDKDTWFDDEKYEKPKQGPNFDEAKKHDYYFGSYSSHHIHEEMLKDTHRTLTYQQAIEGNPMDFKDKIVLDIGCGTGILSMFAARAGAKHVYSVDNAEIALHAREIIKQNGFADKITVYKGKIEEIDFPFGEGEVDIIVSEWMGYYLLYESMLDCVLWARDKYLKPKTGKMLPDRCQLYVAAIEDSEYKGDKENFWKNVYGVNMSVMSQGLWRDPVVDKVESNAMMSDSCCILDIDLVNMKQEEVNFSNYYSLKMNFTDGVHALVTWFDASFSNLTNPVVLTTSPIKKYTHWKQSIFYLEEKLDVRKGDVLYGSIATRQDKVNFRELNIKVSYHIDAVQCKKHYDQQYKFK